MKPNSLTVITFGHQSGERIHILLLLPLAFWSFIIAVLAHNPSWHGGNTKELGGGRLCPGSRMRLTRLWGFLHSHDIRPVTHKGLGNSNCLHIPGDWESELCD